MKRYLRTAAAFLLVFLMMFQGPARVLADSPDYISEVKVAMGDNAEDDLAGYTILKDKDGKAIDLNQGAGGGTGSEGNKRVILGYKTTKNQSEAITDLAVMNMKGGYDIKKYDKLIEQRMNSQIIPMIEGFLATIHEYRENLESDDDVNRARAEFMREALNKFTDDDCGGAPLGDLLVNETKFEMGSAYDKLSDAEKKKHCDIVTLFLQADGQVMLTIYSLLTQAADTLENSWMERFAGTTYEDVLSWYDMPDSEAEEQAAKDYEDDARLLLGSWDRLRDALLGAEEAVEELEDLELPDFEQVVEEFASIDENSSDKEVVDALDGLLDARIQEDKALELGTMAALADYLELIDYEDGTMYDFFTQDSSYVENNIQILYPLIACLTEGQRAGLEFLSLQELVMLSNRDREYDVEELKDIEAISVYEGIDRQIYQAGSVALTSDALRSQALDLEKNLANDSVLSTKTLALWCVTGVAALGFLGSLANLGVRVKNLVSEKSALQKLLSEKTTLEANLQEGKQFGFNYYTLNDMQNEIRDKAKEIAEKQKLVDSAAASTKTAAWMSAGFTAVLAILSGISAYMTWQDLKDFYKVDYTPIPLYIVDEASITYRTESGQQMVRENHAAYYKVVPCNRTASSKWYDVLADYSDLNGDVGQQWLALYACKDNQVKQPILADSLTVVVGSSEIPAGYTTGIHAFGGEAAFNLNYRGYDWNQNAKSVFVYFQIDPDAPVRDAGTAGSVFTAGWLALSAVSGLAVGAVVTAVCMTTYRKKKYGAETA